MKLGILTFHKAYNYGAYLQCFSLSKELQRLLPEHTVEVVDYISKNMMDDYQQSLVKRIIGTKRTNGNMPMLQIAKRAVRTVSHWDREKQRMRVNQRIYQSFREAWRSLQLSKESLLSDDPKEFARFLNGKYDVLIVGSDAVWNKNQTSWPNLYLLHDITGCKKMSYAASTYGMPYGNMTQQELAYVKDSLLEFSFIGVRDSTSAEYVKKCTKDLAEPVHTCDPSLVLDLETLPVDMDNLRKKLLDNGVNFDKPIIGLMCSSWLAEEVRRHMGEDYQYVSVYTLNGCEDVFLDCLSPFEWARVFSLFDVTFTHFFHGTVFSLKNGTRTYSIEKNNSYKRDYVTKIQDILGRFNLLDSCYRDFEKLDDAQWVIIKNEVNETDRESLVKCYANAIAEEKKNFEVFFQSLKEALRDG